MDEKSTHGLKNQMWMEIAKGRWASKGEWKNLIWMKT